MIRLLFAALFLIFGIFNADAASRFWNPLIVSGAVDNGSGLCRLTISPAITGSGIVTGTSVTVASITGATGCNVTAAATVIDTTHIDLQGTTFGGVYVSGGCVAGGNWTATNTSNWASSSTATCGSGGQTVPGSSDTVTFDVNSKTGTVTLNFGGTITIQGLTISTFVGTWDNSVNNNNITLTTNAGFNNDSVAVRTINLGSATYTLSNASGAVWSINPALNLTLSAGSSTIAFTGVTAGTRAFSTSSAPLIYGTVTFGAVPLAGSSPTSITGTNTFGTLNISAPNYIKFPAATTTTISPSLVNWTGTANNPIGIVSGSPDTITTLISVITGSTMNYVSFHDVNFTGSPVASNSFNLGNNSGITINGPDAVSGGHVIGGGL